MNNMITIFEQLDWWKRQHRGTFDLLLYIRV